VDQAVQVTQVQVVASAPGNLVLFRQTILWMVLTTLTLWVKSHSAMRPRLPASLPSLDFALRHFVVCIGTRECGPAVVKHRVSTGHDLDVVAVEAPHL
jgi:hypothetical protein